MNKYEDTLKTVLPFYISLTQEQKDKIIGNIKYKKYSKNDYITESNKSCRGMMIILKGLLRFYMLSDEGKEITLYRLVDNDICVLTSKCIIKNLDININILFEKDSEVLFIPPDIMSEFQDNNAEVNNFILSIVSERLSDVLWLMEKTVFTPMMHKVAYCLIEHSALEQSSELSITHSEIANDLGSAREVVTRLLTYLQNEGIIEQTRGKIKILDLTKLSKF